MKYLLTILVTLPVLLNAQNQPGRFFYEGFKEIPAETPVTQNHIANDDLIISLYGPGADGVKKSHHDTPVDDPYYIWSGVCESNWAVTLKHKSKYVDIARLGKIRWRSKQSGFRQLHIILKLADGSWLISNLSDPASKDWWISEFNISDIQWIMFDIETISEKQ